MYIFTLALEIPRTLQFLFTAWYMLFALTSLAYKIPSGPIHAFDNSIPIYLKFYTVSIFSPYIYTLESQFTNIAYVFSRFILSAFYLQNYLNVLTRFYNFSGEEAISTISSAKDSKNNCSYAIVYAYCFVLSILCVV